MGVTWVALAAVAYYTGLHEADEISDGQLQAAAQLWLHVPLTSAPGTRPSLEHSGLKPVSGGYEQPVGVLVWQENRLWLDTHGLRPQLPDTLPPGYRTTSVAVEGQTRHWRHFTLMDPAQPLGRRVTVVMDLDARNALGRDIAEHIARPAFIVLPLVAWLLAWALRRGLSPLRQLSARIDALVPLSHQRLDTQLRFEDFSSTVKAINALMDRLEQQIQQERDFASDIAHELRTPLTALALQANVATASTNASERALALRALQAQALHAGDILAQLLAFARARRPGSDDVQTICLIQLARKVVGQHAQAAVDSGHELSLEITPAAQSSILVQGRPLLLELALRNLIDNALKHTARGTHVQVDVYAAPDGQGIGVSNSESASSTTAKPPEQGLGLGLGLMLVKRIAAWHGALWQQDQATPPWHTRFALHWPATPAATSTGPTISTAT